MIRRPPRSTLFPTRRSSDLDVAIDPLGLPCRGLQGEGAGAFGGRRPQDRKSTRLNSSHTVISYAVFCLKKKKKKTDTQVHKTVADDKKQLDQRHLRMNERRL